MHNEEKVILKCSVHNHVCSSMSQRQDLLFVMVVVVVLQPPCIFDMMVDFPLASLEALRWSLEPYTLVRCPAHLASKHIVRIYSDCLVERSLLVEEALVVDFDTHK